MTKTLKSTIAKGLGVVAGLSMLLGGASVAGALTMQEAQTLISVLGLSGAQAQAVLALAGGSSSTGSCYQFTTTLTVGSNSAAVKELQKVLNSDSATKLAVAAGANGSAGYETTYFGPATATAVVKYQVKHGISPTAPRVGPMTMASLNAGCTSTPGSTTPPPVTGTTGPIMATLSTDNPAVGTVLSGQATADLAHFTFTGNGTLTQVTLQRTGLSTSNDISNVYLFNGNQRVSDGASVNTSGAIVFSGLNIPVNGSLNLSVKADMASSTTSVSLGVTLTGYMVAGSTTATSANLAGNIMFVSTAPTGTATATLSANTVAAASVNAGLTGYTVWSAPIQISGRAAWLKGANFRVIGSAPSDAVQNIKLYVDGTQVGNATSVGSNGYAFFDFGSSPVSLSTGSHTIDVRGDIQKGSNRTFQFSIQNAADLTITDSQIGINIATTNAVSNGSAGVITVNSGSVTITVDPTFQTMTNVTGGATNAVIGKFKLHAYGEDVKVNTLYVKPTLASQSAVAAAGLNNVTLFFNGSQVGSSTNMTSATTQYLTFTLGSAMVIPAGVDSYLEVRADLTTYSTNLNYQDGTVSVKLTGNSVAAGSTLNNAQGLASLDSTIDVPASDVSTSGLTIQVGSLTVGKNAAYANQTISPNSNGAKIASFVLQNQSTSESVRITNLAVNLALTTAGSTNYSNLVTDETSGSGTTPINPATASAGATSSNNFSVNFTLAPGATKTINVMADIGSATGSLAVSFVPTAIGVSSNVSATPSAITGQTITIATGSFSSPTLVTSASTTAQFVAAAGGATDGSKAEFNLVASNGTANVSEAKFVVRGSSTVSARGTIASVRLAQGTTTLGSASVILATTNSTTLSTQLTSAQTTATIASGTGVAMGSVFLIDSEKILVGSANAGTTTWNITRGFDGTTAATHAGAATVSVMNEVADINGFNLNIPNNTAGVNVDAYPTYASVGTNGTTSGTISTLSLGYLKYTIGGSTQTSCVASLSCTNAIVESSTSAPTMTLVGSKPIITVAQPSATLAATSTPAIDVTVTADPKGDITLVSFPITVGLNGASVSTSSTSNIAVYAGSDLSTNLASSNTAFSAATGSSSTITLTNSGYRIAAGQSVTFHVYVTLVGLTAATAGSDSMATSLATGSGFSWTDTAGGGSATTGTTNIYGYPSSFSAIIKN